MEFVPSFHEIWPFALEEQAQSFGRSQALFSAGCDVAADTAECFSTAPWSGSILRSSAAP